MKRNPLSQCGNACSTHLHIFSHLHNPAEVENISRAKRPPFQWFVSQVARATKGKADPNVTKESLMKALEARKEKYLDSCHAGHLDDYVR